MTTNNPTRRDALRAALALAAGSLLPTWLLARSTPATIALAPFCACEGQYRKYDCSRPFVQAGAGSTDDYFRYATDGHICLRLPAAPEDRRDDNAVKLPPASALAWKHDQLKGWRKWPASEPLVASDSDCLECGGVGLVGRVVECPDCEGYGCWDCRNHGRIGQECPTCHGNAIGTRPGIQRVGGLYVALRYDQRVREHLRDVEYAEVPMRAEPRMVALKFDGGCGLLMALDGAKAEERMRRAKL